MTGGEAEWRQGRKVPVNVYDGGRPVFQAHSVEDAQLVVDSVNARMAGEAKDRCGAQAMFSQKTCVLPAGHDRHRFAEDAPADDPPEVQALARHLHEADHTAWDYRREDWPAEPDANTLRRARAALAWMRDRERTQPAGESRGFAGPPAEPRQP